MTSGIDSRTILDTTGAEDLLGRGDMLYQPIDAPRAVRLQGVLVTDPEIEAARAPLARAGRHRSTGPRSPRRSRDGKGGGRPGRTRRMTTPMRCSPRRSTSSAAPTRHRPRCSSAACASATRERRASSTRWRTAASSGPADGSRFREVLVTSDGWGGDYRARTRTRARDRATSTSSGRCCAPPARGRVWTSPGSSATRRSASATSRRSSAATTRDLPGAVYTKGFLRNYGAYLGLDPEYLIDLYRHRERRRSRPSARARRLPPRPLGARRSARLRRHAGRGGRGDPDDPGRRLRRVSRLSSS